VISTTYPSRSRAQITARECRGGERPAALQAGEEGGNLASAAPGRGPRKGNSEPRASPRPAERFGTARGSGPLVYTRGSKRFSSCKACQQVGGACQHVGGACQQVGGATQKKRSPPPRCWVSSPEVLDVCLEALGQCPELLGACPELLGACPEALASLPEKRREKPVRFALDPLARQRATARRRSWWR
jgi:hypothetical protein